MNDRTIAAALHLLEQSGDFRVLRRLQSAAIFNADIPKSALVGIVVDVETTGLEVDSDEVIELGMIKFLFDRDGRIGRVLGTFESFNEPSTRIPSSITNLTGIRDEDVKGHKINEVDVGAFVGDAALVIAHNAAFDRPFCEKLYSGFYDLSWACSATQIDWRSEGVFGSKLEYIAYSFGRFYEPHRAIDDCNALVNVLSFMLPRSKVLVFDALLNAARRTQVRIFAEGAPYDLRLGLKRLGYRWNDGLNGYPRAWWKDVSSGQVDNELMTLSTLSPLVTVSPKLFRMTAKSRFRREMALMPSGIVAGPA
jgi:DNA polymerase III subunit epsilon